MQTTRRFLVVLATLALTLGAGPALAQQSADLAQGELVSLDTGDNAITIRTADGARMDIHYNDQTKVMGAESQVAGLATKAGTKVSVKYVYWVDPNIGLNEKLATEINVQPPAGM